MFGFLKKAVSDLYLARPDSAGAQLVYRWPDQSIPNMAKLTVRADECVLFFKQGTLVGKLEAGVHPIDSKNLPFLGDIFVSPLTNDNHFLTELFFVRKTEHPYSLGPVKLGSFQDISSRMMVTMGYSASFTVRVTSAEQLLTRLVGMSADVMGELGNFLESRMRSMLQQAVGRIAASEPVLQIASNQYSEELGQALIERTRTEFANDGIEVTRFLSLDLQLDPSSAAELRSYGGKLADLSVQREQADVGNQAGFATYNLVKGQAELMRGVAQGAATHGLPIGAGIGGGIGLGGPMLGGGMSSQSMQTAHRPTPPAPRLGGASGMKYYLRGPGGVEGPYPPRQIALRAVSLHLQPDSVFIRLPGGTDWELACDVPDVAQELEKRLAKIGPSSGNPPFGSPGSPSDGFERALTVAAVDKIFTTDEVDLLAILACSANLAKDAAEGRQYVLIRARALGCEVQDLATPAATATLARDHAVSGPASPSAPQATPSAGGPPPLRLGVVYTYDNGAQRIEGLSAKAVATRLKGAPDGVHMVWWTGAADWTAADEVDGIKAELAKLP